jgi:hypothetical protein
VKIALKYRDSAVEHLVGALCAPSDRPSPSAQAAFAEGTGLKNYLMNPSEGVEETNPYYPDIVYNSSIWIWGPFKSRTPLARVGAD